MRKIKTLCPGFLFRLNLGIYWILNQINALIGDCCNHDRQGKITIIDGSDCKIIMSGTHVCDMISVQDRNQ